MRPKTVVIVGAGPAGLTAAREILDRGCGAYRPVVCEADSVVGGISRTVNAGGNRIDIGAHRFFSKSDRVSEFWSRFNDMPVRRRVSHVCHVEAARMG